MSDSMPLARVLLTVQYICLHPLSPLLQFSISGQYECEAARNKVATSVSEITK